MSGPEEGAQSREERVEARYQDACWAGVSKHDLIGQIIDLEDVSTERDRLRDLLRVENGRADKAISREEVLEEELELAHAATRELHHALSDLVDHTDATCSVLTERDRYRSAWLSANRRAALESVYATEALALRDAEIADLRAQVRELTHGVPTGPLHLGL